MANIPLQYPFPYKTINSTGFTSSVEFVNVTVLGDVTIDQNLTVSGNITTTDLTVGDDLTVGGQIDAQVLRAYGIWDVPTATVTGAGSWIGFDASGHTIFANRKSTVGQSNSFRWHAYDHTNAFSSELMRLSSAGNLFVSGTRIEFPLIHFTQPTGTYPNYDFILPTAMGSSGQVLTSAGAGNPTYWTTPSGGGGGGGTVTTVSAGTMPSSMSMTISSPSTTPIINISMTTSGTGAFIRQDDPLITTGLTIAGTTYSAGYIRSGTVGVGSGSNISDLFLTQVGLGGGYVNQYIRAGYTVANGYYISINPSDDFVVNGGRAIFNGSGNVGIGTASPAAKLHVVSSGDPLRVTNTTPSGATFIQYQNDIRTWYAGAGGSTSAWADKFLLAPSGTASEAFVQTNIGNIGIGTTSPSAKLHVSGGNALIDGNVGIGGNPGSSGAKFSVGDAAFDTTRLGSIQITQDTTTIINTTNNIAALAMIRSGNFTWGFGYKQNSNSFGLGFGVTSNFQPNVLTADVGGNIGIGTLTPSQKLSVIGSGIFYNTTNVGIQFGNAAPQNYTIGVRGDTNNVFAITDDTAAAFRMVIDTTGYVGIGTSVPSQKLHVNNGRLRISDTNDAVIEVFTTSYSNYLYTKSSDGHFIFDVSSRNIGIGTTTPSSKLEVNGTVRATNFTTNGTALFQYTEGSFTPRLGAWRRATNVLYELTNVSPVPNATITATYSTQSGYFSKIGKMLTYNCEVRWTISTGGIAPDDYDIVIILPDGYNPNTSAVVGPCLNYPNTISSISNPMGTLVYLANFSGGGTKPIICPTTGTGQIAYPIFAPGGTQVLTFSASYPVN